MCHKKIFHLFSLHSGDTDVFFVLKMFHAKRVENTIIHLWYGKAKWNTQTSAPDIEHFIDAFDRRLSDG